MLQHCDIAAAMSHCSPTPCFSFVFVPLNLKKNAQTAHTKNQLCVPYDLVMKVSEPKV